MRKRENRDTDTTEDAEDKQAHNETREEMNRHALTHTHRERERHRGNKAQKRT